MCTELTTSRKTFNATNGRLQHSWRNSCMFAAFHCAGTLPSRQAARRTSLNCSSPQSSAHRHPRIDGSNAARRQNPHQARPRHHPRCQTDARARLGTRPLRGLHSPACWGQRPPREERSSRMWSSPALSTSARRGSSSTTYRDVSTLCADRQQPHPFKLGGESELLRGARFPRGRLASSVVVLSPDGR